MARLREEEECFEKLATLLDAAEAELFSLEPRDTTAADDPPPRSQAAAERAGGDKP